MYEVVSYRNCDCRTEGCPGERETILFQHEDKPQCINFRTEEEEKEFMKASEKIIRKLHGVEE